WRETGLRFEREVFADVVAEPPAETVQVLAKPLKVDAGIERADLGPGLVIDSLPLRARDTGNRQYQDHPNTHVPECHKKPLQMAMRDLHRKTGTSGAALQKSLIGVTRRL